MNTADMLQLAAYGIVAATLVGLAGSAVLRAQHGRPVLGQIVVVAITSVLAVAAGVIAASGAMFDSDHDLQALLIGLATAGAVGVVTALLLARRLAGSTRSLEAVVRSIGEGEVSEVDDRPATDELAHLADELATTAAKLDEARRRERALDTSRRELVAWVSHDLRTPLAGIRAVAEALEDGIVTDPETIARYHQTIRSEVERLSELVDDLFELSRINVGALQLRLERVQLGDVVSDALAAARPAAQAKGVHLEGRLANGSGEGDGEGDGVIELSTAEVLRILRNLLDNAIRHTPADGAVVVEAELGEEAAYVKVSDTCGGIPEPDLDRVFDLAFRGDAARSPADGGAGLGLVIARGLAEAHHGDIAVVNEGPGCRFTVRLPR